MAKLKPILLLVGGGESWCVDPKLIWKWKIEICLLVAVPETWVLNMQEFCKPINLW